MVAAEPEEPGRRGSQNLIETSEATVRNMAFYFKEFMLRKSMAPVPNKPVWLLGQEYPVGRREEFEARFRHLVYFSYRRGLEGVASSDMGWGCMLRAMQMLFCNVLLEVGRTSRTDIINLFLSNGLFSVEHVCSVLDRGADRWFSSGEACSAFREVLSQMHRPPLTLRTDLHFGIKCGEVQ